MKKGKMPIWLGWALPILIALIILSPFAAGVYFAIQLAKRTEAMSHLGAIEKALDGFIADHESYPLGDADAVVDKLNGTNSKKARYLHLEFHEEGHAIDPWDSPYKILDRAGDGRPRIYSLGPDRRDDHCTPGSDDLVLSPK